MTKEELNNKKVNIIIEDLNIRLKKLLGQKLIKTFLFGSYSKGKNVDGSDIDFMVLIDTDKEEIREYREKLIDIMVEMSLEYDLLISITENTYYDFLNYSEYIPFYKNIAETGIEIYAA